MSRANDGRGDTRGAESGKSEDGTLLRLLVVHNDPLSGPGTLEWALMAGGADLEFWLPYRGVPSPRRLRGLRDGSTSTSSTPTV